MTPLPVSPERLLPMTVKFWRIAPSSQDFDLLLGVSWIALIPFPRWTYKFADTFSSISPVEWRLMHQITERFQEYHLPLLVPSLSWAACHKNDTFPIKVFSTKDFRLCSGASNSTWVFGPENMGRINFQRTWKFPFINLSFLSDLSIYLNLPVYKKLLIF